MIAWLHSFHPQSLLVSIGPVSIHWYGLFVVAGIVAALWLSLKICPRYGIKKDDYFDLAFWLIISGLIGARLYDVFLQFGYYLSNPLDIFKVWQGGLAIHGALIAGFLTALIFAKKRRLPLAGLIAATVPGLALGQAIGRWGNYFNQEIFGRPTGLPWGIPIDSQNRPLNYIGAEYFHPTFLYESLGCLLIAIILGCLTAYNIKRGKEKARALTIVAAYMLLYSCLRFSLEFIRTDYAPLFFGLRWPQVASLLMIAGGIWILIYKYHDQKKNA